MRPRRCPSVLDASVDHDQPAYRTTAIQARGNEPNKGGCSSSRLSYRSAEQITRMYNALLHLPRPRHGKTERVNKERHRLDG